MLKHFSNFGEFFKKIRQKKDLSLREFCLEYNLDPGNISRMERGLMPPPVSREILERYASYLGIKKNTDEWYTFFDLAAASAGKIPDDVMKDEDLVKKLPLIFRTLRGQKLQKDQLNELAKLIKENG